MHILFLIILIISLYMSGGLKEDMIRNILAQFKDSISRMDTQEQTAIETEDYYQDEDGNLVIVIPEGYSVGGLDV